METPKDENTEKYILGSKQNIDSFMMKNEYRKAFGLLIMVLERLDDKQKNELVDYYSKNMTRLGIFDKLGVRE